MPKRKRKERVLFVYSRLPTFIQKDVELLRKHFNLKLFFIPSYKRNPLIILELIKEVIWADVVFSWFATTTAFLLVLFSRILRRKSVIVVGGYGIAYFPEIRYGALLNPISTLKVKFVLENSDKIIPFSNFAKRESLNLTEKANIDMIPLACDTEKFRHSKRKKENIVLTVCTIKKSNIARKGLETFVESARLLPETKFVVVGRHKDSSINYLRRIAPSNVKFTGYMPEEGLIELYQRAKVYCQLSYQEGEGAGGAVGEAMACKCIPVVSSKAVALRETVGDCGFYVPYNNVKATSKAISAALHTPPDLGTKSRNRIEKMFSMKRREKRLSSLIKNLLNE